MVQLQTNEKRLSEMADLKEQLRNMKTLDDRLQKTEMTLEKFKQRADASDDLEVLVKVSFILAHFLL